MDEQQMEQRIRTAMDHAAPDTLDQILASCSQPSERACIPFPAPKPKRKRRWASLALRRGFPSCAAAPASCAG